MLMVGRGLILAKMRSTRSKCSHLTFVLLGKRVGKISMKDRQNVVSSKLLKQHAVSDPGSFDPCISHDDGGSGIDGVVADDGADIYQAWFVRAVIDT